MSILASSSLSQHLNTQGYQYNHGRSQSDQTSARSKTMDVSGYSSDDTRIKRHREEDNKDVDEAPSTPKRARTAPSSPVNYPEDEETPKKRSGMMTPPPSDPVVVAVSPLQNENAGTSLSTPMSSPKAPKLPPIRVRPEIRPTVKPVSIIENSSLYFPDTSYSYFSGRTTLPKSFTESNIREAKDENEEWRETVVHTLRANDGEKFREFRNFCHSAGAGAGSMSPPQPVVDEHFDSRISSKAAHEIPRLAQLIDRRLLRTESSTGRLYNTTNIVNFPFVNNYTYQSHDYLKDLEMLSTTAAQNHQRPNHYYYNVAPSVAPAVPPPQVVYSRAAMPPLTTPTVPLSETRRAPQTTSYYPPPSPKKKPVNLNTQTRFFTSPKMAQATTKPTSPTSSTRVCISCKSNQSPCWRPSWSVIEGQLCNSCGLRYKKTGARCLNKQCLRIPAKGEWSFMKSKGKTNAALYDDDGNKVGATLAYKCLHCDGAVEVEEGR